jgi:hypothetical protein
MIGSGVASAGLFLSAFSNGVATLMVSNGIIAGTGLGMVNQVQVKVVMAKERAIKLLRRKNT